jgi:hypothetical protein
MSKEMYVGTYLQVPEYERLKALCGDAHLKVNDYLRQLILNDLEVWEKGLEDDPEAPF